MLILLMFVTFMNPLFSQDSLKIMTYNLQGMRPGSDPETRLFHIIQKLKTLNPDIIGLQEINETLNGEGNQGQRIADSLSAHFGVPYYFYQSFTHLSWNNQFREYVGIISKHPVAQQGFLSLSPGVFPRKVVWNSINTTLGIINFFNTHLSFNSNSVRVLQVQQIIPYVQQHETSFPGIASILSGDFNAIPGSEPISLLTTTGSDTFYFDTFREINPTSPGFTVPAQAPDARIDFIFLKNTGDIEIDTSLVVMNQPYSGSNYCSDHFGVMTIFSEDSTGSDISLPTFIDFGDVLATTSKDTIMVISNPGTADLEVSSISSSSAAFSVNQTTFTVPPGGSEDVTVTFTPPSGDKFNGILTLESNAGRDRYVFLSGTGITINVITTLDFGYVRVNTFKDSVVSISNPSNAAIAVNNIVSNNPVFTADPTNFVIPPGGEENITITFTPNSAGINAGTLTIENSAGNVFVSLSGTGAEASSWSNQISGTTNNLNSVYIIDASTGWAAGENGAILKTTNGGSNWMLVSSGVNTVLRSVFFADINNGWVVGNGGNILYAIDEGTTWTPQTSGTSEILLSVYFINAPAGRGWTVGTAGKILKTTNGGANWSPQSSGTINGLTSVHFEDADRGWIVGLSGIILKTTNGGSNWESQYLGNFMNLRSVFFVDTATGWAAGHDGVILKTTDGGDNWDTQSSGTLLDLFSIHFSDANAGWAVGENGTILKTEDGGSTWIPQFSGVTEVLNSVYFANSNVGFITGSGGIILNTTNGGVASIGDDLIPGSKVAGHFQLFQNYPNPFNPETVIGYQIPTVSEVQLSIFNLLGQRVRLLVNKRQLAGRYQVSWVGRDDSGRQLSSGIYIYRLQAGGFMQSRKLLLLK
jgi:photosystem II stability/assembly factor-like uncharacterized protein/endonuclease/exonuclease/phosphatase family metal-dependent hydrolase